MFGRTEAHRVVGLFAFVPPVALAYIFDVMASTPCKSAPSLATNITEVLSALPNDELAAEDVGIASKRELCSCAPRMPFFSVIRRCMLCSTCMHVRVNMFRRTEAYRLVGLFAFPPALEDVFLKES